MSKQNSVFNNCPQFKHSQIEYGEQASIMILGYSGWAILLDPHNEFY